MQGPFDRQKPKRERDECAVFEQNSQKNQTPDQLCRARPRKQADHPAAMLTLQVDPHSSNYIGAAIRQEGVDTGWNDRDHNGEAKDQE